MSRESEAEQERQYPSSKGWRVRFALLTMGVIALSLALIAVFALWFVVWGFPELMNFGWELLESIDALAESLRGVDL